MSRELIAAQSGWGKSWFAQRRIERNLSEFDRVVVLDYEAEFHGLTGIDGVRWLGVDKSFTNLDSGDWAEVIQSNRGLVAARYVAQSDWQEIVAEIGKSAGGLDETVLLVIDECHFVAPLRGSIPDDVTGIATTGRGRGVSSIWVTQRIALADTTVTTQCNRRLLGGFTGKSDLSRVADTVDYPADVHNPQGTVSNLPPELQTDSSESVVLRETGPGSEWIYSSRSGERSRIDSSDLDLSTTHLGDAGEDLKPPA